MSVGRVRSKPNQSAERGTDSRPLTTTSDIDTIDLCADDHTVCYFERETFDERRKKAPLRDNFVIHDFLTKREYVINNFLQRSELREELASDTELTDPSDLFTTVRKQTESEYFKDCDQEVFFDANACLTDRFRRQVSPVSKLLVNEDLRFDDVIAADDSDDGIDDDDHYSSYELAAPAYDVCDLLDSLDQVDCEAGLFVTFDDENSADVEDEANSLVDVAEVNCFAIHPADFEQKAQRSVDEQDDLVTSPREDLVTSPMKDINEIAMSREAMETRSAIFQTLQGMTGGKNKGFTSAQIPNKGVVAQKRIKNNRAKYNNYTTMTNSVNVKHNSVRGKSSKYNSADSEVGTGNDDYSSGFSSSALDCDDSSSESNTSRGATGVTFPKIFKAESTVSKRSKPKTRPLERVNRTNYRIPGVGKYTVVMRPDREFEITPPGYDCRYDVAPAVTKEERELPASDVQKRSVIKCKSWLRNVYSSPLSSLQPAANN